MCIPYRDYHTHIVDYGFSTNSNKNKTKLIRVCSCPFLGWKNIVCRCRCRMFEKPLWYHRREHFTWIKTILLMHTGMLYSLCTSTYAHLPTVDLISNIKSNLECLQAYAERPAAVVCHFHLDRLVSAAMFIHCNENKYASRSRRSQSAVQEYALCHLYTPITIIMITRWNLIHSHTRTIAYLYAEICKTHRNTSNSSNSSTICIHFSLSWMHAFSMPMHPFDPLKLKPNKFCCEHSTIGKKTEILFSHTRRHTQINQAIFYPKHSN